MTTSCPCPCRPQHHPSQPVHAFRKSLILSLVFSFFVQQVTCELEKLSDQLELQERRDSDDASDKKYASGTTHSFGRKSASTLQPSLFSVRQKKQMESKIEAAVNYTHSRTKRQLYPRNYDNNMLSSFSTSFPVFASNLLTDNIFSGGLAGLFDGSRFGQESKVHQVSAFNPAHGFGPNAKGPPQYSESMEHFPNPFPTVPMDHFDFEEIKSASEDEAMFGGKGNYGQAPFPPMNFNPQTGTFYEPIFGSQIPASLLGDFTPLQSLGSSKLRLPSKIVSSFADNNKPGVQNFTRPPVPSSPAAKAKLVAYEYMYKPISMLRAPSRRPPLRDKIPVSTTQISYEKVNLPPLRDDIETTSKPTYKQDSSLSPAGNSIKESPGREYAHLNEAAKLSNGFQGMHGEHFGPKDLFAPEPNSNQATSNFAVSHSLSNQQQNFLYKPLFSPSSLTVKQNYDSAEKYTQNQMKPRITYANHPEMPLKQYKDYHQSFNHEPVLPYKTPAFSARIPNNPRVQDTFKDNHDSGFDKNQYELDSDPWKYLSPGPPAPEMVRPVFIPAVKTFSNPPFRKHRPLFLEPENYSTTQKPRLRVEDTSSESIRHQRPSFEDVTTPIYGQKLSSKTPTSTQRIKITPPQVVKSATYHQNVQPPYTRPFPVVATTSSTTVPPSSTSRSSFQTQFSFTSSYYPRERPTDWAKYGRGSQRIPSPGAEPEDDSQERSKAAPKLQFTRASSTSSTTESNDNYGNQSPIYEPSSDYVDTDSKPDKSKESSQSASHLDVSPPRDSNKYEEESEDPNDPGSRDVVEELEEVEQSIQTPPKAADKIPSEAKKAINLFRKRPDYTKFYSKYTKSPASSIYGKSSTTTTTTSTSTSTTTPSSVTGTKQHYQSIEEAKKETVGEAGGSFGSRLSHSARNPIVSVKTSTSTTSMKSYPYSPKSATSRNRVVQNKYESLEKSGAASDERATLADPATSSTTSTSAPSLKYAKDTSFSRFRSRFSTTTTSKPSTHYHSPPSTSPASTSSTSTTTAGPSADASTPTLFVGKLGNLQDLGMFDVDDPEEEEAIDVPVMRSHASEESNTSSSTTDGSNSFKKIYSSNSAGTLNARMTGQRHTKNTPGQKSTGYLSSFFKHMPSSSPPSQDSG